MSSYSGDQNQQEVADLSQIVANRSANNGPGLLPRIGQPARSFSGHKSCVVPSELNSGTRQHQNRVSKNIHSKSVPFNESYAQVENKSREKSKEMIGHKTPFSASQNNCFVQHGISFKDDDEVQVKLRNERLTEQHADATEKPQMVALSQLMQQITEMQNLSYQLFEEGKNVRSIAQVDKVVKMRRIVEGPDSNALIDYISETGRLFNQAAMEILSQGDSEEALQMLLATQAILSQADAQNSKICSLFALSLNNLSVVYKRMGEISEAQECLQKILGDMHKQETQHNEHGKCCQFVQSSESQTKRVAENPALLHLNLCALFSQQSKHERAKTHANLAIVQLKEAIQQLKSTIACDGIGMTEDKKIKMIKKVSLLAVAYFNLGCELEHLGRLEASLQAYKQSKGLNISRYGYQQLESELRQAIRQIKIQLKEENGALAKPRHGQQKRSKQQLRSSNARKAPLLPPNPSQPDNQNGLIWRASESSGVSGQESSNLVSKGQSSIDKQPISDHQQQQQQLQLIQEEDNNICQRIDSALKSAPNTVEPQITPAKDKMCKTYNSSAVKDRLGKAEQEELEQRGIITSKTLSQSQRPASAHDVKKQLFGTQISRSLESGGSPLPVRCNRQATKCLKHVNWTHNWLQKAFIQVNNSNSIQFENSLKENKKQKLKAHQTICINEDSELEQSGSSFSVPKFTPPQEEPNETQNGSRCTDDHQYQPSISINIRPMAPWSSYQRQSQQSNHLHSHPKQQQRRPASVPEVHQVPPEAAVISQASQHQTENPVFTGSRHNNSHFDAELKDFMRRYVYPNGPATAYLPQQCEKGSPTHKRHNSKQNHRRPSPSYNNSLSALPSLSTNYKHENAVRTASHDKRHDSASSQTRDGMFVNGKLSKFSSAKAGANRAPTGLQNKKVQSLASRLQQKKVFSRSSTESGLMYLIAAKKKELASSNVNAVKQFQMTHKSLLNFQLCDHNEMTKMGGTFVASTDQHKRPASIGNNRRKQSSQAKILKRMSQKPAVIGAPRSQSESRMRQPNQRMQSSQSQGHLQAVERYTQGPIIQLIRPIDKERSMLVTQTVNSKSKKREILVQYLIDNKSRNKSHLSQTPDMMVVQKPPLFINQPVIPIAIPSQPYAEFIQHYQPQEKQKRQSESAFTKALRQRVIRQTRDIFDKVTDSGSKKSDDFEKVDIQKIKTDDDLSRAIAVFDSPMIKSYRNASQTGKSSLYEVEYTMEDYDRAATVIQSVLRGQQARKITRQLQMQMDQVPKATDMRDNSMPMLQLECDDYKDDSFHSVHGKSEEVDRSFKHSHKTTFQNEANDSILVDLSPDQLAFATPDESIVNELTASIKTNIEVPIFIDNESSLQLKINKLTILIDGTTQTSVRDKEQPTNDVLTKVTEDPEPQPSEKTDTVITEAEVVLDIESDEPITPEHIITFQQMDPEEVELHCEYLEGKNMKLQAVLLPFDGDRGTKIGFKSIQKSSPMFQNELIHIDLLLSRQVLLEDKSKIDELFSKIIIEPVTGNLTLKLDGKPEVALFTMNVQKDQSKDETIEVITVFEYDGFDLSSGIVTVQAVKDPQNKVSIPMKKQASNVRLADIKQNLLKHLPRIIRVDEYEHLYLNQASQQERIGQVLPAARVNTISSENTSRLYKAEGETFRSQVERDQHMNELVAITKRSVQTQQVVKANDGFSAGYEAMTDLKSEVKNKLERSSTQNLTLLESESIHTVTGKEQKKGIALQTFKQIHTENHMLQELQPADPVLKSETESEYEPLPANDVTRNAAITQQALALDFNDISSLQCKSQADCIGEITVVPIDVVTQKQSKHGSLIINEASMSDFTQLMPEQLAIEVAEPEIIVPILFTAQLTALISIANEEFSTRRSHELRVDETLQVQRAQNLFKLPTTTLSHISTELNACVLDSPRCTMQSDILELDLHQEPQLLSSHNLHDSERKPESIQRKLSLQQSSQRTVEYFVGDDDTLQVHNAQYFKLPTSTKSNAGKELTAINFNAPDSPRCISQSDILELNLQVQPAQSSDEELQQSVTSQNNVVQQQLSQQTKDSIVDDETIQVQTAQHLFTKTVPQSRHSQADMTIVRPSGLDSLRYTDQSDIHEHNIPLQSLDKSESSSDWKRQIVSLVDDQEPEQSAGLLPPSHRTCGSQNLVNKTLEVLQNELLIRHPTTVHSDICGGLQKQDRSGQSQITKQKFVEEDRCSQTISKKHSHISYATDDLIKKVNVESNLSQIFPDILSVHVSAQQDEFSSTQPLNLWQDASENLSLTSAGYNNDKAIEQACGKSETPSLRSLLKLQVAAQKKQKDQIKVAQEVENHSVTREEVVQDGDAIYVQSHESSASSIKHIVPQKSILINKVTRQEQVEAETARQAYQHISWADESQSVGESLQQLPDFKPVGIAIPQQEVKVEPETERKPYLIDLVEDLDAASSIKFASNAPKKVPKILATGVDITTESEGPNRFNWEMDSVVSSIKPICKPPLARPGKQMKEKEEINTERGLPNATDALKEAANSDVSSIKQVKLQQAIALPIKLEKLEPVTERIHRQKDIDLEQQSQISSLRQASVIYASSQILYQVMQGSDLATEDNNPLQVDLLMEQQSFVSSLQAYKTVPLSPLIIHQTQNSDQETERPKTKVDLVEKVSSWSAAVKSVNSLKKKKSKVIECREQLQRMMTSKTAETKKGARAKSVASLGRDSMQSSLNLPSDKSKQKVVAKKLSRKFQVVKKQKTILARKKEPLLDQESSAQSSLQLKVEETESNAIIKVKKRATYKTQATKVARRQKVTIDQDSVQSSLNEAVYIVKIEPPKINRKQSLARTELNACYVQPGLEEASAMSDSFSVIHQPSKPQNIVQILRKTTRLTDLAHGQVNHTMDHESQLSSLHLIAGEVLSSQTSIKEQSAIEQATVRAATIYDEYADFKNEAFSAIDPEQLINPRSNIVLSSAEESLDQQPSPLRRHATALTSAVHPFRFDKDDKIRVVDDNCITLLSQVGQAAKPIQVDDCDNLYAPYSSCDLERALSEDAPESPLKVSLLRLSSPYFEQGVPVETHDQSIDMRSSQMLLYSEHNLTHQGRAQAANSVLKLYSEPSELAENNLYVSPSKVFVAMGSKKEVQENPTFREAQPYYTPFEVEPYVAALSEAPVLNVAESSTHNSMKSAGIATQQHGRIQAKIEHATKVSDIVELPANSHITNEYESEGANTLLEVQTVKLSQPKKTTKVLHYERKVSDIQAPSLYMVCQESSIEIKDVNEIATQGEIFVDTSMHIDDHVSSLSVLQVQAHAHVMKPKSQVRTEMLVSTPRNAENQSLIHYATDESSLQVEAVQVCLEPFPAGSIVPTEPTPREAAQQYGIKHQSILSEFKVSEKVARSCKAKPPSIPITQTTKKEALRHLLSSNDPDESEIIVPKCYMQDSTILLKSQDDSVHVQSEATAKNALKMHHESMDQAPLTEMKPDMQSQSSSIAESYVNTLLKIKPSKIKSVKSKQRHIKSNSLVGQALPLTRRADKSKHIASQQTPSEFTEVLQECSQPKALHVTAQQLKEDKDNEQLTSQGMLSTQRDISVNGGIMHLYQINKSQNTNSQTNNQVEAPLALLSKGALSQNMSRIYGGTNGDADTIFKGKFWDRSELEKQSEKSQLECVTASPMSEGGFVIFAASQKVSKSISSAVTEGFAFANSSGEIKKTDNANEEMKLVDVIHRHQPSFQEPDECIVDDWRAGVKIRFTVTGQNSSSMQLLLDGEVQDTKSIAFSLTKIAQNYDVADLGVFCKEWIMPCVAIKKQEWITAELQKSPRLVNQQLYLQLHGEMLSELIFKQFKISEQRPTSAFTLAPHPENQDEARFYEQDLSQMDETLSKDEQVSTEEDQEIPLQMFDNMKKEVSNDEYYVPFSENATTAPAQVRSQLVEWRMPLDRSATQIEIIRKNEQDHAIRQSLSTQNKSVLNDL